MTFIETVLLIIIMYICLYAAVNRICGCVEYCAIARAYAECKDTDLIVKGFRKLNKEGKNE